MTDIRSYKELKNVELLIKCKMCGESSNTLKINWTNQKLQFMCLNCGYNTEMDKFTVDIIKNGLPGDNNHVNL